MATATKTTTSTQNNHGTPVYPKSHPPGLWVLFTTEMWERFCYYGMRAFLVLYLMSKASSANPGLGWTEKEAYNLYGIYTGLVYLMPLLGGWVADRFIGPHRSVFWGGVVMALGEFVLAGTEFVRHGAGIPVNFKEDPIATMMFFTGLGLMIVGTGFFKPCISVMVGQLYGKDDPRRDGAFTIFYMGVNLGAFLAPLVAGTVAEKIGWSYGFLTAGVGMIFGLCTYSFFRPLYLKGIGLPLHVTSGADTGNMTPEQIKAKEAAEHERTRPLTRVDYDRMFVIAILVFFTIAFWTAFEQAGSTLNVFAKKETDRRVSTFVADTTDRLVPASLIPFLDNEFAQDLKNSIDEVEGIQHTVASILQKTPAQRKLEEEYRNKKSLLEMQEKRAGRAQDNTWTTIKNAIFGKEKDKLLFDVDGNQVPASALVRELLERAKSMAIHEKIVLDTTLQSVTHGKSSRPVWVEKIPVGELFGALDEMTALVPVDVELPKRFKTPEELAAEEPQKRSPSAELVDPTIAITPDAMAQQLCYMAGYQLSQEDLEILLSELKKYPTAKKQLEDMMQRTITLYDSDRTDVVTFPATWYQSVNAMGIVIFAPIFAVMWVYLGARGIQPSTPVKFGIGLLLLSVSFVVMIPGAVASKETSGLADPQWLLWSYLFATWGELCLSPVGLSMVTKLSPARFGSLMMGVWFLSSAAANYLSGYLASVFGTSEDGSTPLNLLYGSNGGMADFFLVMAVIPAVAGLTVLVISPVIKRMMHGIQ